MTRQTLINFLEELYPPAIAEEWDNVGLLVGDPEREVKRVFVALDLTDENLDLAIKEGADFIVTHHPLIFKAVSRVTTGDRVGRRILKLAEERIGYYAMHTNFDIAGMAALNASDLGLIGSEPLEVTGVDENGEPYGLGRVGELPQAVTASAFAETVKHICGLERVRLYGEASRIVKRAAVCGGSGRSLIGDALRAGADIYVTGDLDYHSAIDAVADGLTLIDAGHYGTESGFIACVGARLEERFADLEIIRAPISQPYTLM